MEKQKKLSNMFKWSHRGMLVFFSLLVLSISACLLFYLHFYSVSLNFCDTFIENSNRDILRNISTMRTSLQNSASYILNDNSLKNVMFVSNPSNQDIFIASGSLKKIMYINNIYRFDAYDSSSDTVWSPETYKTVSRKSYTQENSYFNDVYNNIQSNNRMFTVIMNDKPAMALIYTDMQKRSIILYVPQEQLKNSVYRQSLPIKFETWLYYSPQTVISTNSTDDKDILLDAKLYSKLTKKEAFSKYYSTVKDSSCIYISSRQGSFFCISKLRKLDAMSYTIQSSYIFWIIMLIALFVIFIALFIIQNYYKIQLKTYEQKFRNASYMSKDTQISAVLYKLFNNSFLSSYEKKILFANRGNDIYIPIYIQIHSLADLNIKQQSNDISLYKYGMCNIASECFSSVGISYSVPLSMSDNMICVLIITKYAPSKDEIMEICQTINTHFTEYIDTTAYFTVCKYSTDYNSIIESIHEGANLLNLSYISEHKYLFADSVKYNSLEYPMRLQESIYNSIKQHNINDFETALYNFIAYLKSNNCIESKQYIILLYINLSTQYPISMQSPGKKIISEIVNAPDIDSAAEIILKNISFESEQAVSNNDQFFQSVNNIIAENYTNSLFNINDAASQLFISASHLGKKFKKLYGCSFNSYLASYRIEQSCKLLTDTNMKLTAISEKCGFNSASYYTTTFKKYMQISPQEFRKDHKPSP